MAAFTKLPRPFVAVVTGGTSGIGRATALALAAAGADVALNSRRADEKAMLTRLGVEAQGARALHIAGNVGCENELAQVVEEAWAWQGRVDLWVNVAGADILSRGRHRWSWDKKLQALASTDMWGTVRASEWVVERMKEQGWGQIINVGWDMAEQGRVSSESGRMFSLIKAGVMAYSRTLARAAAPEVRVNCVAPGWIETDWGENVSRERYEAIRTAIPLQRWGQPEDVAHAILWLASPAAQYITGQTIIVNGGA